MLTRGTEAANEASEVPSTLSLLARRGDLQKTRAITTEPRTLDATNEVVLLRRRLTTVARQA